MAQARPAIFPRIDPASRLLISGSRDATPEMLNYTRRAVRRAHSLGWSLVVGDANGVDEAAIREALNIQMPLTVYGVTPRGRVYTEQPYPYNRVFGSFLNRDTVMAELASRGLCIWNGYSRGTKFAYDELLRLGKRADLIRFGR